MGCSPISGPRLRGLLLGEFLLETILLLFRDTDCSHTAWILPLDSTALSVAFWKGFSFLTDFFAGEVFVGDFGGGDFVLVVFTGELGRDVRGDTFALTGSNRGGKVRITTSGTKLKALLRARTIGGSDDSVGGGGEGEYDVRPSVGISSSDISMTSGVGDRGLEY